MRYLLSLDCSTNQCNKLQRFFTSVLFSTKQNASAFKQDKCYHLTLFFINYHFGDSMYIYISPLIVTSSAVTIVHQCRYYNIRSLDKLQRFPFETIFRPVQSFQSRLGVVIPHSQISDKTETVGKVSKRKTFLYVSPS